jgi:hypothetical protein
MTAVAPNRPRPRKTTLVRISRGAAEAAFWVLQLKLHNPAAKSILRAAANYADDRGAAYPGIETLARDTEYSEETIVSRLRWCEEIGAVVLLKCWVDESGRRNFEGRGRVTSTEIRFCYDTAIAEINASALGAAPVRALRGAALSAHERMVEAGQTSEVEPRDRNEFQEINPRQQRGLVETSQESEPPQEVAPGESASPRHQRGLDEPALPAAGTRLAPGLPPTPAARSRNLELEDSPPPTPSPNGEGVVADPLRGWKEFESAITEDGIPILKVSLSQQIFSTFSDPERALVTKAAKGLVASRKHEKKPSQKPSAQTLLREPGSWEGFAKHAPIELPPPTWIAEGTREFAALVVLARILGPRGSAPEAKFEGSPRAGERGFWRRLAVSPDLAGLSVFADVPETEWKLHEEKSHQFVAWAERFQRWTGYRLEPQRILTGEEKPFTYAGKTTMVKQHIMGARTPCEWPPRKDGTTGALTEAQDGGEISI